MSKPSKVVIVDNYDSFTGLIAYYMSSLIGEDPLVFFNDEIDVLGVQRLRPKAIIISPGPGHPAIDSDVGACPSIIRACLGSIPLLGICLGHQLLCHVLGGTIVGLDDIRHGEVSDVKVDLSDPLYRGFASDQLQAMRYHSLALKSDTVPADLKVSGISTDGVVMSVTHRAVAAHGVQFHPESIATPGGWQMITNFLESAGIPTLPRQATTT
jgi:anthranilate synthase/aminodeoxychorismate synthase-like glutamine amidotransferase